MVETEATDDLRFLHGNSGTLYIHCVLMPVIVGWHGGNTV